MLLETHLTVLLLDPQAAGRENETPGLAWVSPTSKFTQCRDTLPSVRPHLLQKATPPIPSKVVTILELAEYGTLGE